MEKAAVAPPPLDHVAEHLLSQTSHDGIDTSIKSSSHTPAILDSESIEIKFIETETRTLPIFWNLWNNRSTKFSSSERRDASVYAFLQWLVARLASTIPRAAMAGGISLTAIATAFIALKANELLDTQNRLSEAQRRAAASQELTSIYESISQASQISPKNIKKRELPSVTEARIVLVLHASRPYKYLDLEKMEALERRFSHARPDWREVAYRKLFDGPKLSDLTSPERGQIIVLMHQAEIDGSRILARGKFDYADLSFADLKGADLRTIDGGELSIESARFVGANLRGARMQKFTFSYSDLRGVDLSDIVADMGGCERCVMTPLLGSELETNGTKRLTYLRPKVLSNFTFLNAEMSEVMMDRGNFWNVDFLGIGENINMASANLSGSVFSGGVLAKMRGLKNVDSARDGSFAADDNYWVVLDDANIEHAIFENTPMNRVRMRRVKAKGVRFDKVSMRQVDFSEANLEGANFSGSTLEKVSFAGASVKCADFRGSTVDMTQLALAKDWKLACLSVEQSAAVGASIRADTACVC